MWFGSAAVSSTLVPMVLPTIIMSVVPVPSLMPTVPVFPEMRLERRVLSAEFCMTMPPKVLPIEFVPVASVPMKFPSSTLPPAPSKSTP